MGTILNPPNPWIAPYTSRISFLNFENVPYTRLNIKYNEQQDFVRYVFLKTTTNGGGDDTGDPGGGGGGGVDDGGGVEEKNKYTDGQIAFILIMTVLGVGAFIYAYGAYMGYFFTPKEIAMALGFCTESSGVAELSQFPKETAGETPMAARKTGNSTRSKTYENPAYVEAPPDQRVNI